MNVTPYVIPTAEPFLYPGNRIGCLLIHGFTGAPKEMRTLGEYLHSRGHTVLGIRLPGHATNPADMLRTHWQDWTAAVEDGYNLLKGCTDHLFMAGLSMGGALALQHAARFPVDGVISLSTPHHLQADPRLPYIKILRYLQPTVPKGSPDWHDPSAMTGHIDYLAYPTRAIAELRDLLAEMRRLLPQITAPALVIHSRDDKSVLPEEGHPELIYNALSSTHKSLHWIEGSGHVITRDARRQEVFELIEAFIDNEFHA